MGREVVLEAMCPAAPVGEDTIGAPVATEPTAAQVAVSACLPLDLGTPLVAEMPAWDAENAARPLPAPTRE